MKYFTWLRALALVALVTPPAAQAQSCPGDLDGDNQVTVDELVQSVDRALTGCPPASELGGPFDGEGRVLRSACPDPADNGSFGLFDLTIIIVGQQGSRFSGYFTAVDDDGKNASLDIVGSVDADGLVRGTVSDDAGEVTGTIHGGLAGDGLSLSILAFDAGHSCSISATLLAARRG